jgi:hypothetical protein
MNIRKRQLHDFQSRKFVSQESVQRPGGCKLMQPANALPRVAVLNTAMPLVVNGKIVYLTPSAYKRNLQS